MNPDNLESAALDGEPSPATAPGMGRDGSPVDGQYEEADTQEITYEPIPPRQTVTVSVRYRVRGRGRPLPYELDEGDGG